VNDSRKKLFTLAVGLLLASIVIALGMLSFQRKLDSFKPLGFTPAIAESGSGWQVLEVGERDSGLHEGDQILLVNGAAAPSLEDLRDALQARPASELVVERSGTLETVTYQRQPIRLDLPYLILASIGILYLLVGLYTLLRNPRGPGVLFYAWSLLYALFFLVSTVGIFEGLDRIFYAVDQLARLLLPPLTVHFFLVFPNRLGNGTWVRRGLAFLYLPGAVLLTLQADLMLANGSWLLGSSSEAALRSTIFRLQRLDLYHLVILTLIAGAILTYRVFTEQRWQERRQLQWVALGLSAGYLPFLGYLLLQQWAGEGVVRSATWVEVLAVLPLALVPLAFAGAILRYKLWDVAVIVRDTISYSATAIVAILGFSLVNLAVSRGLPDQLGDARNLISFSAGLLFAAMVAPVRKQVSSALERVQYRGSFALRRALTGLAQELLQERDLQRLCTELLTRTEQAVGLEKFNLFLTQHGELLPARAESTLPEHLSIEAFEEETWEQNVSSLSSFSLPAEEVSYSVRLYAAGYRYALPLRVRGKRIGIAVASYKLGSQPLNSDDQDLMRAVLNQAALAIENAQLLEQLHGKLDEVSRLQRYSEGILQASPAGMAVLDTEDQVLSVNAAFCAVTGCTEEEITRKPLENALPVRPLPEPGAALLEASYCDPGGNEKYLHLRVAPFRPGSDQHDLRLLLVHDVTEQVSLENALKEQDRLASLGMLAAGVAHEVNTPLTGISSYAQMLLDDTPEEDPRHGLLKKVEAQTFRAARIVNNLLEFARNRSGEYRPVTLSSLLDDTLDLLREQFSKRRVQVSWEAPEDEIVVYGSDGELQQVFTNLLLNASDALAEGGGNLQVAMRQEKNRILVTIEDDGPGIARQRLDKIFEPFYSTKLSKGGTGLGLSISYDIVRRHHGEMRVWSRPGEGTRFTVDLPRYVA